MRVRDFAYDLPGELIAQRPLARRDASRLMVVKRTEGTILHRTFLDLPDYFAAGEVLVLNETKVIPAKAWGRRGEAVVGFLFLKEIEPGTWEVLCKPARRIRPGDEIAFDGGLKATAVASGAEGRRVLRFPFRDVLGRLKDIGFAPLPPYIKRRKADAASRSEDLGRYQTVFAAHEGAVAAPTAGLHFTPEILQTLRAKGVEIARVTLHVGPATFQPIRTDRVEDHKMLEETYLVSEEASAKIGRAKAEGRPVVAVGTTVVRTLESAVRRTGEEARGLLPGTRSTDLFIYPGFEFRVVDRLLTNFHLPRSTLLVLVSAFAGRNLILEAYHQAVRERYRFYSYGDCMLIL